MFKSAQMFDDSGDISHMVESSGEVNSFCQGLADDERIYVLWMEEVRYIALRSVEEVERIIGGDFIIGSEVTLAEDTGIWGDMKYCRLTLYANNDIDKAGEEYINTTFSITLKSNEEENYQIEIYGGTHVNPSNPERGEVFKAFTADFRFSDKIPAKDVYVSGEEIVHCLARIDTMYYRRAMLYLLSSASPVYKIIKNSFKNKAQIRK